MGWDAIDGHGELVTRFRQAVSRRRLASSFLFVGPPGIGKRTFAIELAKSLLCEVHDEEQLRACGNCPACVQVDAMSHPDLNLVSCPPDKSFLPVELLIGDRDHRMREGLIYWIGLKPYRGRRKIAIVDDADELNNEGANCLLKTLEEPPPGSLLVLIGTSEQKQLPTIRSRCQVVRFQSLPEDSIARLLLHHGCVEDGTEARRLASLSGGSMARARELADGVSSDFREVMLGELGRPRWDSVGLAKSVAKFVEEAGDEARPRRERAGLLIAFAAEFYRQWMRGIAGRPVAGDEVLRHAVETLLREGPRDAERAAACLQRCLDALAHVQANAHPPTLIDCWIDDLAAILRDGVAAAPP